MTEVTEASTGSIVIPDLIDDFRDLVQLNTYMENHGFHGATEHHRDELADAIGEKIVGHRIKVTELPLAKETKERPIEYLGMANPIQIESLARGTGVYNPNRRLHPATGTEYIVRDFFRYRRKIQSKVEAVDGARGAIVARHRIDPLTRAWIRVVNTEGEPLVDITAID